MRPLALAGLWVAIAWFGVACAIVLSLWPGGAPLPIHVWDKIEHCVGYFILTLWFTGLYPRERYPRLALGCLWLGILIELLQGFAPTRTMELGDLAANGVGVGLAMLLALLGAGGWAQAIERLLGYAPRAARG